MTHTSSRTSKNEHFAPLPSDLRGGRQTRTTTDRGVLRSVIDACTKSLEEHLGNDIDYRQEMNLAAKESLKHHGDTPQGIKETIKDLQAFYQRLLHS